MMLPGAFGSKLVVITLCWMEPSCVCKCVRVCVLPSGLREQDSPPPQLAAPGVAQVSFPYTGDAGEDRDPMLLPVSHWFSTAGDVSSIAGRVTKVHAPQLLKATCPRAGMPQQEKPPPWEAHAPQLERHPSLPQLEKDCTLRQRPSVAKK